MVGTPLGSCVIVELLGGERLHGKVVDVSLADITLTPSHHVYKVVRRAIDEPAYTISRAEILRIDICTERITRLDSTYMYITQRMDRYAIAFVTMMAAVAGCTVSSDVPDIRFYDLIIGSRYIGHARRSPNIFVQVKSHRMSALSGRPGVPIVIERDCFQEFRQSDQEARLLIGVALPANIEDWVTFSPSEMMSRFRAYYCSIRGKPMISTNSVTVHAPFRKKLTPSVLVAMMHRIGNKGSLDA